MGFVIFPIKNFNSGLENSDFEKTSIHISMRIERISGSLVSHIGTSILDIKILTSDSISPKIFRKYSLNNFINLFPQKFQPTSNFPLKKWWFHRGCNKATTILSLLKSLRVIPQRTARIKIKLYDARSKARAFNSVQYNIKFALYFHDKVSDIHAYILCVYLYKPKRSSGGSFRSALLPSYDVIRFIKTNSTGLLITVIFQGVTVHSLVKRSYNDVNNGPDNEYIIRH